MSLKVRDQVTVRTYCEDECERQGYMRDSIDWRTRVEWMLDAWEYAHRHQHDSSPIDVTDVIILGKLVERHKNEMGLRKVDVRVGRQVKMNWQLVPQALKQLLDHQGDMPPADFYYQYETIHPFVDGNGRTGKVLLNWLNKSLDVPIMPPNFWNSGNP